MGIYIPQLALIILRSQDHDNKLLLEWLNLFGLEWQLSHNLGSIFKVQSPRTFNFKIAPSVVRPHSCLDHEREAKCLAEFDAHLRLNWYIDLLKIFLMEILVLY